MAFIRTGVIIVLLLLGWAAVRVQPAAHIWPQQATLSQTFIHKAS